MHFGVGGTGWPGVDWSGTAQVRRSDEGTELHPENRIKLLLDDAVALVKHRNPK